jgi:L-ascorbate metabolism protein UlaG (beta-lactamase superfamily)
MLNLAKKNFWKTIAPATFLGLIALAVPDRAFSFCHEIEVVKARVMRAAAAPGAAVSVEWLGHAMFQITSSKGTRILTDPHGRGDMPSARFPQNIVTASHPHGPHSAVWMAKGNPAIFHGLTPTGENWNHVHTGIRDVSVYTVPAYHDKSQGLQRGKNAIFVFRVDDVCIAHLGDLGHELTPAQLKLLGKIDILLLPIAGGMYTVTATEAREVTKQINPKIAVPMHYDWEGALDNYIRGNTRVRKLSQPVMKISKQELPQPTEVVVFPVP